MVALYRKSDWYWEGEFLHAAEMAHIRINERRSIFTRTQPPEPNDPRRIQIPRTLYFFIKDGGFRKGGIEQWEFLSD